MAWWPRPPAAYLASAVAVDVLFVPSYISRVVLDTLRHHLYKTRPRWIVLSVLLVGGWARAEVVSGAQLPDGAVKVGENRYRVREDFEATLKYYKGVYPPSSFPRKAIINQPGIKAIHIANPSGKSFEGLNIYNLANDEVRIYIVPAAEQQKPAKRAPEGKKKKKGRSR